MLRQLLPVLAFLGLLTAGGVYAQESRVDPALRLPLLLRGGRVLAPPPEAAAAPAVPLAPASRPFAITPPTALGPDGRVYLRALAWLEPGGEAALERLGARIGVRTGDVVSVRIPADALAAASSASGVRYLEAVRRLAVGGSAARAALLRGRGAASASPSAAGDGVATSPPAVTSSPATAVAAPNDSGTAAIGVDGLRSRAGDRFVGLTGRGVIIGVVDTGLDLGHEDFLRADGTSRVLYAWDQGTAGRPPGAVGARLFDYGYECSRAAVEAGDCPLRDNIGHGTHVAGIAAGDGSATGNGLPGYRFTGVAPEADVIVVKAGESSISSDRLLEGVAYIFERAAQLGRPAVVNLSVTTQAGPHDGSTMLEHGLDQLAGPGRIIVAGAGNQGVNANEKPAFVRAPSHAQGQLAPGAVASHTLVVPSYTPREGTENDGAVLELWYDGVDSLTVTLTSPGGDRLEVATGDSAIAATPGGTLGILNGAGGPQASNGDHQALIALADIDGVPPASGDWTISVARAGGTGSGAYHLWLVGGAFDNPIELARLRGGTANSHLVGSPATADRVIAVAAFATKHAWLTLGGDTSRYPVEEPLGDIAFFSSPGPRRDGVLKPEIAAPGKMVVSARAAAGGTWEAIPFLIEEDGVHAALPGTSMAAPFVTGAVAILLQLDAELTPERARELLARSARRDAFTAAPHTGEPAGTPNAQWGYGKLDVAAAVRLLRPDGVPGTGERVNLSANPVRSDALVINYAERPAAVAIYGFTGERVRSFSAAEIGAYLTVWRLVNDAGRAVANGAYILVLEFPGERVLKKIFVVRP